MVNRALRTQDIEIIITMSFFLCDLHRNIEQIHLQIEDQLWKVELTLTSDDDSFTNDLQQELQGLTTYH